MLRLVACLSFAALILCNLYHLFAVNIRVAEFLLLPNLYRDIAGGTCHWFYWCLPPSRYIFPDLLLFLPLGALLGNGLAAFLALSCLYAFSLCAVFAAIVGRISGISFAKAVTPSLLTLALFTLPGFLPDGILQGLLLPSWHGGTVFVSMLAWLAWANWLSRPSPITSAWLMAGALSAGFCEPLCFPTFVAPAALAALFSRRSAATRLAVAAGIFGVAMLGSWCADKLVPLSLLEYIHQNIVLNQYFWKAVSSFVGTFTDMRVLPWWALAVFVLGWGFYQWRRARGTLAWWVAALLVFTLPVVGSVLTGRFAAVENTRYFPLTFFLPFAVLIFLLWRRFQPKMLPLAAFGAACMILSMAPFQTPWREIARPLDARLFDELHAAWGLKSGLAYYQRSVNLTYHSRHNIFLADLEGDGNLMTKLTSLAWLGLPYLPPPRREYNYIITQNVDVYNILAIYGPPSAIHRIYFQNRATQLWVYDRDLAGVLSQDPRLLSLLAGRAGESGYMLGPKELSTLKSRLGEVARQPRTLWIRKSEPR